jgi:dTDP-4-dehydrorhamnose reductase
MGGKESRENMHEERRLELWGGVECTYNRVGDDYFDQCERTGHATRLNDLDLIAELGIRAIRYPVLWEKVAPNGLAQADWSWTDERLNHLRSLGVRPIVGLVHHGSGPRSTSLVDHEFPARLAEFAEAAARRYLWVQDWTPVNEPLTTARFSGLYGYWYPHGKDDTTFIRALLTQCRAVVIAMRAIRQINPNARLVQTDDLGKTWSTPTLEYQADFENARRWVTFDLLCGKVDRDHPLWRYLRGADASESEILWFQDNPCPPDLMGINHYLSSERFLDERLDLYPEDSHGGNGQHQYADVLAARVREDGAAGPAALLREAWERYRLPIAITEAHNGCTREEQLRWLREVWDAAQAVHDDGVDVRAVTVWSLFGVQGWDNLVTRPEGTYEPGVFDLRGPHPRPTAIAGLMRDLAAGREPCHPLYMVPGWWHRPDRLIYGFSLDCEGHVRPVQTGTTVDQPAPMPRRILVTGGNGTLGQAFARACAARGLPCHALSHEVLDIADPTSVDMLLDMLDPWAVVNAAGYVSLDGAERDPARCYRNNTDGPAVLAAACARRGIAFLTFSSDVVFDGRQRLPYVESDPVAPLNVYGQSKAAAETRVMTTFPEALVVRCGAFFSPWDTQNGVAVALGKLALGLPVVAANDVTVSLTYVPDLVNVCLDLLIDGERGIWHLANPGALIWSHLLRITAALAGLDTEGVSGRPVAQLGYAARRPRYSVLGSERGLLLPPLEDALARYVEASGVVHEAQRRRDGGESYEAARVDERTSRT